MAESKNNWPAEAEFNYGDPVEKHTGEARWLGRIVSAYLTEKGGLRYVVSVHPQGFQMIAVPSQLRSASAEQANVMEVAEAVRDIAGNLYASGDAAGAAWLITASELIVKLSSGDGNAGT